MKALLKKNWHFYILGFIIIYGLKHYYNTASAEELNWILAPTAWWTQILSGNTFERALNIGYVNYANEFVIVSSCSGMNFLIISFSTLLYSFIHRWDLVKKKLLWIIFSFAISYLFTIGVNGLRIIFSIYLFNAHIYNGFITPERVHRIEGTVVYVVSLFTIFMITERLIEHYPLKALKPRRIDQTPISSIKSLIQTFRAPLFWYFLITLGIPFVNKAYKKETPRFVEHSIVIISICLIIIVLFYLLILLQKRIKRNLN